VSRHLPESAPCVPACPLTSLVPGSHPLADVEATQAHTGARSDASTMDGADTGDRSRAPQAAEPSIERAVLDATEVGQVLGVGRTKVHELHGRGELPAPVNVGSRGLRWARIEIEAWLLHGTPPRVTWERVWPRVRKEVLRR
jgi:predicted DNA-binding transcriptional regulator AlpA